jgi:hypothetical protein
VSVTGRDKRILLALVPLLLVLGFWFLLLSPKRDEAAELSKTLSGQEQQRDQLQSQARTLEQAQASFTSEYASVVRLGKAIPSDLDVPSLLVQLDDAASGTGIRFDKVTMGDRLGAAPSATTPPTGSTPPGGSTAVPADAGGAPAQSAPGTAAESAGNAVNSTNQQIEDRSQLDPTTSESSGQGGLPVGGGTSATGAPSTVGSSVPGLDAVPLELSFHGKFFGLADFFHRVKRFVRVAGERFEIGGRLVVIDGFSYAVPTDPEVFKPGELQSQIRATVYLVPEDEGVTAGATPQGPAPAPVPASDTGSPAAPVAPTATVTP